jgi:CheY-like chemotaxis protein
MTDPKKILIIDDDADFLLATRLVLEGGGYQVFSAEDGKSGVEMVETVVPDLIITDMMMETWGEGFTVVTRIRALPGVGKKPLVVLSSVDIQGHLSGYQPPEGEPKADLILHKPIKSDELLRHVRNLLTEYQQA